MALKLITAASTLVVSLVDVKTHLRVDASDEDDLIISMIIAATEMAEHRTGRALLAQTWELTLDAFPAAFELTRIPVASVSSLKYVDGAGVLTTMDAADYALDSADDFGPAFVVPSYGESWPSARDQINAVALRFVAGYASADAVPEIIKSWIKLQVGAMYEHRESETTGQTYPLGFVDGLLDRHKVY